MTQEALLKAIDSLVHQQMQDHMDDPVAQLRILEKALRSIGFTDIALRLEFLADDLMKHNPASA